LLIKKRHRLSSKDLKDLIEEVRKIGPDFSGQVDVKKGVELVEDEDGLRIYLQDGKPILIDAGGRILPSLAAPQAAAILPRVTVDMGAVPFVVKGADVMAPGIRTISEGTRVGDLVLVVDEKHSKGLAIGVLLMEREEVLKSRKGKAVKNMHHVGDDIWGLTQSVR